MKVLLPGLRRVAVVWDPSVSWHKGAVDELSSAARSLSLDVKASRAGRPEDFAVAFPAMRQARIQAAYVLERAFFVADRRTLIECAFEVHLPMIYGEKAMVEEGALMSYAANFDDIWRRSARYVDRILKGARPAELPIEQPTQLELIVNLKTANALGITIPESLLLRADEVIR